MKKWIIILCLCLTSLTVLASGRLLPADLIMARLGAVQPNSIELMVPSKLLGKLAASLGIVNKKRFELTPGIRIYKENNTTMLTGQLYQLSGKIIGVTFNDQRVINAIWDLTEEEIAALKKERPHVTDLPQVKTK